MNIYQKQQRWLKLGDVIRLDFVKYGTGTVTKIDNGIITVSRPYIQYDAEIGVRYIGLEEFTMYQDSDRLINVIED